ncbi:MAG: methylated-DNA--[Clostridia bacterium]|nr:methylated-DNA--[protein]-cysteine S-methyltransferase [Clostridia bacterium]
MILPGTFEKVYEIVRCIPAGRVASYGQIARLCGMPRGARIVGYAMAACKETGVPCHRVVDAQGRTKKAFDTFLPDTQRMRLEDEGVGFLLDGRVNMAEYQWEK